MALVLAGAPDPRDEPIDIHGENKPNLILAEIGTTAENRAANEGQMNAIHAQYHVPVEHQIPTYYKNLTKEMDAETTRLIQESQNAPGRNKWWKRPFYFYGENVAIPVLGFIGKKAYALEYWGVKQAGAALEYFEADEKHRLSRLGIAKVVSAGMASFAITKLLKGVYHVGTAGQETLGRLSVAAGDMATHASEQTLATLVFMGSFVAVSKIDTAILQNIRYNKTAKAMGLVDQAKNSRAAIFLRTAMIAGSVAITGPWVTVAANHDSIHAITDPPALASNDKIRQRKIMDLEKLQTELGNARTNQDQLVAGQAAGGRILTAGEQVTVGTSQVTIARLSSDIARTQAELTDAKAKKDQAKNSMEQESGGTLGAREGQGPLYKDAQQKYANADRDVTRLEGLLSTAEANLRQAEAELKAAEASADARVKSDGGAAKKSLDTRVNTAGNIVADLEAKVRDASEIEHLVKIDPNYKDIDDISLAEQFGVYLDHANKYPTEYINLAGLLLIFMSMEMASMLTGMGLAVTKGERREMMAEVARQAILDNSQQRLTNAVQVQGSALTQAFDKNAHEEALRVIERRYALPAAQLEAAHQTELRAIHRDNEIDALHQRLEMAREAVMMDALKLLDEKSAMQQQQAMNNVITQILKGEVPDHIDDETAEKIYEILRQNLGTKFVQNLQFDLKSSVARMQQPPAPEPASLT